MELFMSLKKLTESAHRKAEQSKWAQLLISGDMTNRQYGQYLYNQLQAYSALETRANELKLFAKYPILKKVARANNIAADLGFFKYHTGLEASTLKYIDYTRSMNEEEVLAHIYVRHFGDMHGGQIIKSKLPEPNLEAFPPDSDGNRSVDEEWWTNLYAFDDKYDVIKEIRTLLTLDMADEANICFEYAMDLFHDLEKHFDL
jgi:heme oxygenase